MNVILVKDKQSYSELSSQSIWESHIVAHWQEDSVVIKKDRFSLNPTKIMSGKEFFNYLSGLRSVELWESQ